MYDVCILKLGWSEKKDILETYTTIFSVLVPASNYHPYYILEIKRTLLQYFHLKLLLSVLRPPPHILVFFLFHCMVTGHIKVFFFYFLHMRTLVQKTQAIFVDKLKQICVSTTYSS